MTELKEMSIEETENNVVNLINLRWGYDGGGMACGPVEGNTITETTWVDSEGKIFFVSVSRMMEFANVYVSDTSLFDLLLYMTRNDVDMQNVIDQVNENSNEIYEMDLHDLSDYQDSENKEMIEITLIANDQYCHMEESVSAEEWLNDYNAGRIELDWSSDFINELMEDTDENSEEENIEGIETDDSYEAMERTFKRRLALETELEHPSVYTDMDGDAQKSIKTELKNLKTMYSNSLYKEWKGTYIAQEFYNHKDENWVTVPYIFAGMGQYSKTFPKSELEYFKAWIDGNGSAFMGEPVSATEEEIKTAIALAADNGLDY